MNEQESILASIGKAILSFFLAKKEEKKGKLQAVTVDVKIPIGTPDPPIESAPRKESARADLSYLPITAIDWDNPESSISKHFTVKEACWLPSWKVMHNPSDEEKQNIVMQANKMDLIREFLGVPINVHCWIRPVLNNPSSEYHGKDYNLFVKGAKNSAHKIGLATDYDAKGLNCDDVREKLEPKLEEWQIRMEKMPGGNWVHNDCTPVVAYRYFNP